MIPPRSIIATTPKSEMKNAALEAESVKRDGSGRYFRVLHSCPKGLVPGRSRVYYVEDGYIRGFCVIESVVDTMAQPLTCDTTGREWGRDRGVIVYMDAKTWTWISPIRQKGFQGWRYFTQHKDVQEVGGWLDPKPEVVNV